MPAAKTLTEAQADRIDNLIEELSPADYLHANPEKRNAGDGWIIVQEHYRGLILIDPDGNDSYHVEIWAPRLSWSSPVHITETAHVSWPSFGNKPNPAETRKFAKLCEVAADYAEALDRLANQIIKEDA